MDPNQNQWKPQPAPQPSPLQPQAWRPPRSSYQQFAAGAQQRSRPVNPYMPPQQPYQGQSVYLPQPDLTGQLAAPSKPSRRRHGFMAVFVLLGLALVAGGATYVFSQPKPATPAQVLQTALTNALSTRSLTQITSVGPAGDGDISTTRLDLTNIHDPHVSVNDTITTDSKTTLKIEGYGSYTDTYLKTDTSSDIPAGALGQWMQIRKDNTLPTEDGVADTSYPEYDPRYCLLGQIVFGNLPAANRQALVNYMIQNDVYQYDASQVTKTTVNGVATYKYDMTLQHLSGLNQEVAKSFGITDKAAIQQTSELISDGVKLTVYSTVDSPHIVKVTLGSTTTVQYKDFDTTSLPAEPKPDIQYSGFLTATAIGGNATSAVDYERAQDLLTLQTQLETYHGTTGNYPTLSDMNSSDWLDINLPHLDQTILKDPAGASPSLASTPTTNQYAYQVGAAGTLASCEADATTCQTYILTATFSNGTAYVIKGPPSS